VIYSSGELLVDPERYPNRDMTGIEFRIVGVVVEKRKRY